ncbi:hypothetical protein MFUL124B02_23130 [Myxococcus fulvus 124B02]|nr:hypothetical protein MFUL124B02_23130 [Myxococcus fulvus 124B02]
MPLMMSPRYAGRVTPSSVSTGLERGLANWPAMRPTFTTGLPPAKVSTSAIWRMRRKVSRMLSEVNSLKLSAQSPPWSRKALPWATWARAEVSLRVSAGFTSRGSRDSSSSTRVRARASG